jgi:hypothetical protein
METWGQASVIRYLKMTGKSCLAEKTERTVHPEE